MTEVDGDITNELQTLNLVGTDLTISSGNTVTLPEDNDWTIAGTDILLVRHDCIHVFLQI